MNFCQNPSLLRNHGAFLWDELRNSRLSPFFVVSKLQIGGEILMPALVGIHDRKVGATLPWANRTSTVLWRGSTTGSHYYKQNWRESHRVRLHEIANRKEGEISVLVADSTTGVDLKNYNVSVLNEAYLDVGLVGKPVQCEQKDGTCDEMKKEIDWRPLIKANAYASHKYAIDVGQSPHTTNHVCSFASFG